MTTTDDTELLVGINQGAIAKAHREKFRKEVDPLLRQLGEGKPPYHTYLKRGDAGTTLLRCFELAIAFKEWAKKNGIHGDFDLIAVDDPDPSIPHECKTHIILRHRQTGELIDVTNARGKPHPTLQGQNAFMPVVKAEEDLMLEKLRLNKQRIDAGISLIRSLTGKDFDPSVISQMIDPGSGNCLFVPAQTWVPEYRKIGTGAGLAAPAPN